jgi:hypothetical protein
MAAAATPFTFGRVQITDALCFLQALNVAQGLYQTGQMLKGTIGMLLIEWKVLRDALQSTEKANELKNHWDRHLSVLTDDRIENMKGQLEEAISAATNSAEGETVALDDSVGDAVLLLHAVARGGGAQYCMMAVDRKHAQEHGGGELADSVLSPWHCITFQPTDDIDSPKATKEIVLLHTSEDHVDLLVRIDAAGMAHGEWDISKETDAEHQERLHALAVAALENNFTVKSMEAVVVSEETKLQMDQLFKAAENAYNKEHGPEEGAQVVE